MRHVLRRFSYPFALLWARAEIKSKSQEGESIVSHPLKFAEGGAASVDLMEAWASSQFVACPVSPEGALLLSCAALPLRSTGTSW